jgi:hypothetical protein
LASSGSATLSKNEEGSPALYTSGHTTIYVYVVRAYETILARKNKVSVLSIYDRTSNLKNVSMESVRCGVKYTDLHECPVLAAACCSGRVVDGRAQPVRWS